MVKAYVTVEYSLKIYQENENTFKHDSIGKEIKNSRVTFNLLDKDDHSPVGYKKISCHLIFDAKINLTKKPRYVSGGHLTNNPLSRT